VAVSYIANALGANNATTAFSLTLPATQAGDILVLEYTHRGTADATLGGTYSGPAFSEKHDQLYATSTFSGKTLWSRCTGNHSGQTVTGSGLTNSCAAIITQYRGAKASGDPLAAATIVGEQNASGNETQAQITTTVAGAWVVLVVANSPDLAVTSQTCTSPGALAARAELLSTGGTDTSIAHASAEKASAGATGAFTWAQTDGVSGSWAYAIEPEPAATTLVVADAAHDHSADNVALVQQATLAVQDAAHAHAVDNSTLTVLNVLTVADALHAHSADNLALDLRAVFINDTASDTGRQVHPHLTWSDTEIALGDIDVQGLPGTTFYWKVRTADGDESAWFGPVTIADAIVLAVDDALHAHSADSPALVQQYALAAQDALHAHTADSLALVQQSQLAVQDSLHAHSADDLALVQAAVLAVDDSLHGHAAENVALQAGDSLGVQDALHAHTADAPALVQASVLAVAEALHAHSVDSPTLAVLNVLQVADSLHAHSADSVALTQQYLLVAQDALHAHAVDQLSLVQANVLAVAEALHAHAVDNVVLDFSSLLAVADALHGHTADSLALVQQAVLAVNDATHAHSAEQMGLLQHYFLVSADALHAHAADNATALYTNVLEVADAAHAHLAELVALTQANVLAVQDAEHAHTADELILRQKGLQSIVGAVAVSVESASRSATVRTTQPTATVSARGMSRLN
jgi:hypothetical protein